MTAAVGKSTMLGVARSIGFAGLYRVRTMGSELVTVLFARCGSRCVKNMSLRAIVGEGHRKLLQTTTSHCGEEPYYAVALYYLVSQR